MTAFAASGIYDRAHKAARERWSEDKRFAFRVLAPAAYAIVATDGPVSVTLWNADGTVRDRIGGNRGLWPAEVARTTSYEDTVSRAYDKFPLVDYKAQIRVWAKTLALRDFLADDAAAILQRRSEAGGALRDLKRAARDIGDATDLAKLELQLVCRAAALGVTAWTDAELSDRLDRIVEVVNVEICSSNLSRIKLIHSVAERTGQ